MLLLALMLPASLMAQSYQSVPYTQGFEGLSTGQQPEGWIAYQTGTNINVTFPCAYAYSGNARSSSVYYEFEFSSSSAVRSELVATCEFANPSSLMVDFYAQTTTSNYPDYFEVGVMEDSVFVPVDTVNLTRESGFGGGNYSHYRVFLVEYTGDGHRIAFRATRNTSGQMTVFMEDVTISQAPTCAYMPGTPSADADSVSATLTWSEPSVSAGYMLYLNNDETWYNTSTNSYYFSGLTPNTLYTGYLYNTCSGSDTSEAVAFSFRTACGMPEFPLFEDFDTYAGEFPSCWYKSEPRNEYPSISTSARYGGTYGVRMYSSSTNVSIASPYLYSPVNGFETQFWAKKSSSYYDVNLAVGYVSSVGSMDSVVMIDTIAVTTDWQLYTVNFTNIDYYESGHIVYRKIAGGSADLYMDDITIREARACAIPENLAVIGTSAGQMDLDWTDTEAAAWEVAYGPQGMNVDTVVNNIAYFSAHPATVTGLSDAVTYDFYVRASCGGEESYWVGPVTARPNLIVMRANHTDTLRTCGGTIVDDGGLTGNFSTNQNSTIVLYPNDNSQTITLTGVASTMGTYTYSSNVLTIYEGVGTSGRVLGRWDNSTNDSVHVSSNIGPVTIHFSSSYYAGSGFELLVSCSDLADCIDSWNVTVSDVAGGSAIVHWGYSDVTPAQGFEIVVTDTASGSAVSFTAADTARMYQLSGLNQTTGYHVTVTSHCLNGSSSNPVGAYFMTNCYVGGEVVVGDGTVGITSHPFNSYYNYTINQCIFDRSEVATLTDTIFGIKLYQTAGPNATRNVDIYIDTTSISTFANGSSFIPMDSSKLVFSGTVTFHNGWNEFTFTNPWVRPSATNNLLLTFDDNTGSYSSNTTWQGTGSLSGKVLYAYGDGTNYNPLTNLSINTTTNRPNVLFVAPCADANCVAPSVTVASAEANSVTLTWVPGMSESEWTVEYKLASDTAWTVSVASTFAQTHTVTGLMANTVYDFRVGSICLIGNVPFSYVSGRTACSTMSRASLPLVEGFEGYNTGDVPNCWIAPATGTSGSGTFPCCYNYSSNARNGNVYFELEASNGGTEIFALPAFDTIAGLALDFYVATTSSYAPDALEIGVIPSEGSFIALDTVDLTDCTSLYSYIRKSVRISYSGANARIAMRAVKSSRFTVFMDDFTLYVPNPCDSVTHITVDSVSTSSIAVHWTDANATGSYTVKVGTTSNVADAFATYTTTATSYTITGLNPATKYYVFVMANCVSGLSDETHIKVYTACDRISTFPWSEDFESFTAGSGSADPIQPCWNRGTNYTYSSYPYLYSYYNHTPGGSNSLYFYTNGSYYSWLSLPEMDRLDTLMLSFYMLGTSPSYYTYKAIVGAMSDQYDFSTFVPLDTVTYTLDGVEWQRMKVALSSSPDSCHFIAILSSDPGYSTYFVDDISVNYNNGCGDLTNFIVSAVGQSTASVVWTDTAANNNYIVKIATTSNEADAFFIDTVTTPAYNFTGLTGVTGYHVWVYNLCENGLSDVLTGSFTTLASDPHFLPYDNDFESADAGFTIYQRSGANTWYVGSAISHDGNNSLYVTNDGGVSNAYTNTNQSISFAITYLQIPYDSAYVISYDWRCQGEGSYDLMRVALVPEDYDFSTSFTAINRYSNTLPTGWIALDGGKRNLRNTWQYDENTVNLAAGNYYLTIVWTNDGAMGNNPAAAIDNIHMSLLTCPAPQNLTAVATTANTVDVSWQAGSASSWIVEYGVAGYAAGMGTIVTTSTPSVTLNGLAATTSYDIRVRPICSESDTGYAAFVNVLTGCNEVITEFPWVEDFENGIDCWNQQYATGHVAWTTGRGGNAYGGLTGAASGQYNARFTCNGYNGYTTYLVTPQLSIASEDDVMLTFFHAQPAWGTDQDTLAVLYRTHPDSTWHYLASWNNSITTWQSDTVMLPNTTATYQVAFMAHSGYGLGILLDSIVVYGSESCTRPAFTNVNVGSTSIAATWNSPASAFEVAVRTPDQAWPEPVLVNTHSYVFQNLEPSTYYEYRVRSLCSDTSISFWATSHAITDTLECYVVEGLRVDDVTFQTVTLSWNADVTGHAVAYVVSVSNFAFSSSDTVYSNSCTIGNLYAGLDYGVTVQSMCSATTYSDWSEMVNFTTPACQPVAGVTVSDITSSSVTIDWTPQGEEESWIVSWGYAGFSNGSGSSVEVSSHPYTITGLSDDTRYDVYVRPVCTDEVSGSWSDVVGFATLEATGIEDIVVEGVSCSIYPNPTDDAAVLTVSGVSGAVHVSVIDLSGRELRGYDVQAAAQQQLSLAIDGLPQGAYFVRILSAEVSLVRKLVVR